VPLVLAGVGIDRHDRIAEKVLAGSIAAVVIRGGAADGHEDQAAILVGGHEPAPGVRAGAAFPSLVHPRLIAHLSWTADGLKFPGLLAGAGIEGARVAGWTVLLFAGSRADHDQIPDDRGNAPVGDHHVDLAFAAEARVEFAGVRVETDQPIRAGEDDARGI